MTIINEKIKELEDCKNRINTLQGEIISAIFLQFPWLHSIGIDTTEEYDDSNNYTAAHLVHLNKIPWMTEEDSNLDYMSDYLNDSGDAYKGWLVEANMADTDVRQIIKALSRVKPDYFDYKKELLRSSYVKE